MYALTLKLSRLAVFAFALIILGLFLSGCSNKSEKNDDDQTTVSESGLYADWQFQNFGTIKFFYPPAHTQKESFEGFSNTVTEIVQQVSKMLQIAIPQDTMYLLYYTGFGQGREMTGHEYPYSSGDTVYFWLPSFAGPPIIEWLLPKWEPSPTRHQFLRHGLFALLDYSGQNYHKTTLQMVEDGKFIPLVELAVDTNINYLEERVQSAEAASFVDFLIVAGNINIFRTLYKSQLPFEKAVDRIWSVPVDSLQSAWLQLAEIGLGTDTLIDNDNK